MDETTYELGSNACRVLVKALDAFAGVATARTSDQQTAIELRDEIANAFAITVTRDEVAHV